jgi:hypothetical protein
MKIKIRHDDTSTPQEDGWSQMSGWLARLRDDDHTEPPDDGHAELGGTDDPWPEVLAQAEALAEARARGEARARSHAAARAQADALAQARALAQADTRGQAHARGQADARAQADVGAGEPVRPVIGDEVRMPVMWCEMGSCISWYTHPAALGEVDTRARAIAAGWRIDALGRLACPGCQQTDPGFWAACPVVPWDRHLAIARAAQAGAVSGGEAGAEEGSADPDRAAGGYPPAESPEPRWRRAGAA